MKIEVLGCSGAYIPNRYLTGFLLDSRILFDAGSLTTVLNIQSQAKIKHIFVTHAHLDHIAGILFLADNTFLQHKRHRINVLGIPSVLKALKKNVLNNSIWPDFTVIPNPRKSILNLVRLKMEEPFQIDEYTITPYRVNHSVPASGYLVENHKGRRFFYTGDTGPSNGLWKKFKDKPIHCLIIDVSVPNHLVRFALMAGHLTPRLFKEEISKLTSLPEKIYITHLKPQYFKTIKSELQKLKMNNLTILQDGDIIYV